MADMGTTFETAHISVSIERPWAEVYDFTHIPANFALWATGLAELLDQDVEEWEVQGADGSTSIRFSPRNELGVMDHWVFPAPDIEVYVPLRVVPNGTGAEVILTLFRTPGMSDEIMKRDAEWVARDLRKLKSLLEG